MAINLLSYLIFRLLRVVQRN